METPAPSQIPAEGPPGKRRYLSLSPRVWIAGALLAAGAFGLFLWLRSQPSAVEGSRTDPVDPRVAYTGPFQNIHPRVAYVPDSRCADCHDDIAASYAQHPMGRSFVPVAEGPNPPITEDRNNPFQVLDSLLRVDYDGKQVRHRRMRLDAAGRPVVEQSWQVHYTIGSGTRGHSYITDCDGFLFETPISWYSQTKKGWDLSPGFNADTMTGRAILVECVFCHANRAHPVEGTLNRYAQPVFDGHAIGCQRCHGPGELHVDGHGKRDDGIDPTIVNPKHLTPNLRQAICEQCHLQGAIRTLARGRQPFDFRPGLPLEQFWSVFVAVPRPGKGTRAVSQVDQMYQSRCFQGSEGPGRMGCVSCHDPHRHVPRQERASYYRNRCLQCHRASAPDGGKAPPQSGHSATRSPCSAPAAERLKKEDSCIACHMPHYGAADIPHTAGTDHRILRDGKGPSAGVPSEVDPGDLVPVRSFYRGRKGADTAEDDRGLGLGLVKTTLMGNPETRGSIGHALHLIDAALGRDPDDIPAAESKGYALALDGRPAEALAAFRLVLKKAPDRELSLFGAAMAAELLGKNEAALGYWRRTVAANPWSPGNRRSLALLLIKERAWAEARSACAEWVRLDPLSTEARAARVTCLLALGNKAEARAEFARIEAMAPPKLRELQIRFGKRLR